MRRLRTRRPAPAVLFAALGDETRLALVARLACGEAASITKLTRYSRLTRQAITKHLRVLERAGMVRCVRAGRESRFELDPRPLSEIEEYIQRVSREWDAALGRLKAFVEE
ncbi:MAG TPA: metalloregulator ArsR/SmtB family transcription factor [Terracidiphilus sp.]|nr:metalloregulator ArsR/SmtB family transcription factor [Terracidiphilus sp.]